MNVKPIVKVMNFHALLRVEASRRRAEKYLEMEKALQEVMRIIMNNRNLRLDQLIKLPDPNKPVLRIYIGSDLGFCGALNSGVAGEMRAEHAGDARIVIGKKVRAQGEVSLEIQQEDFEAQFGTISEYLKRAVTEQPWSAVELVYNHYNNASSIDLKTRRIYPLDVDFSKDRRQSEYDDFLMEGNELEILQNMMVTYLEYELKIAMASSYASENILRQGATTESLKKIDEMEEEAFKVERKEKNAASFAKMIDNYTKGKVLHKTGGEFS